MTVLFRCGQIDGVAVRSCISVFLYFFSRLEVLRVCDIPPPSIPVCLNPSAESEGSRTANLSQCFQTRCPAENQKTLYPSAFLCSHASRALQSGVKSWGYVMRGNPLWSESGCRPQSGPVRLARSVWPGPSCRCWTSLSHWEAAGFITSCSAVSFFYFLLAVWIYLENHKMQIKAKTKFQRLIVLGILALGLVLWKF